MLGSFRSVRVTLSSLALWAALVLISQPPHGATAEAAGPASPQDDAAAKAGTRPAETPRLTRYSFTALARRAPSARLYSRVPRSSQLP